MYTSIRRYKLNPGAVGEISRRVKEGFLPIVSAAPGFVSYTLVDSGNDTMATVNVFQTQAGAEESNRLAADWVKANIASLIAGPPDISAGEVAVYKTK